MTYTEQALQLRPYIEKAAQYLSDADAIHAKTLYPLWKSDVYYETGFRFLYNGNLYRVLQPHLSQSNWIPGSGTESIYTRIDEIHAGTLEDPVPYEGNMVLEQGRYYVQNQVIYLCTRDTINPVYHDLKDLVGLYVEVV